MILKNGRFLEILPDKFQVPSRRQDSYFLHSCSLPSLLSTSLALYSRAVVNTERSCVFLLCPLPGHLPRPHLCSPNSLGGSNLVGAAVSVRITWNGVHVFVNVSPLSPLPLETVHDKAPGAHQQEASTPSVLTVMKRHVREGMPSPWHRILVLLPQTVFSPCTEDKSWRAWDWSRAPARILSRPDPRMSYARARPSSPTGPKGRLGSGTGTGRSLKTEPGFPAFLSTPLPSDLRSRARLIMLLSH